MLLQPLEKVFAGRVDRWSRAEGHELRAAVLAPSATTCRVVEVGFAGQLRQRLLAERATFDMQLEALGLGTVELVGQQVCALVPGRTATHGWPSLGSAADPSSLATSS